ncbi:hypothetical protein VKT23_019020 [Stygiomarasmius scandens]|uniref:F-box domain-containing protein n=1 Tax=Marasmiellus scandens TaxID=2682957 RepID=A0ABR1IRV2_9AGAR
MSSVELPFDIIECILDHLDDTCALKNCCLINRTVFPAAARSLYRHVVIRIHYWYLDSKKNRKLDSALLSRYSHYVRSMKIESDVANDDIRRAFQTFRNVRSITLDHCNIFNDHFDTELLELLSKHVSLDELDLAIPHTSQDLPDTRRTLAKITTLRKLGIAWPTDGLIQMVAQEWAKKLTVLTDLSLRGRDRTWSVEFMLQMKSIKCLNLGGILQDVDDLPILAQLPHLRELHLRYNPVCLSCLFAEDHFFIQSSPQTCYYNPKIHPKFSLYSLTVEHEISSTRSHNIRLCRWIIQIIGTSSHLHSLSLFEGTISFTNTPIIYNR